MNKLHFTYDMQIEYSIPVTNCNFTIKCIPVDNRRQKISNMKINLIPDVTYQWGSDGFKNTQIWGKNEEPHTEFKFHIEGDAETGLDVYEEEIDTDLAIVFSCPHGLNVAGDTIKAFFDSKIKNINTCTYDKVIAIAEILFQSFTYQSFTTNINTTAEQAFSQGCGVCQDYAHILISLLHMAGISARYVTGFIVGEGESHAWVEFLDGNRWYGIDPTHNRLVNDEYIKIGHGRDAHDCMINRGIMHGGGLHTQTVNANVHKV